VPAIASHFGDVGVGSTGQITVSGVPVTVRVVATVPSFPTVPAGSAAVVVDLATLQDALAAQSAPPLPVTQWWLATSTPGTPPALAGLVRRLPAGTSVTTSAGVAAGLLANPLSGVPQQALLAIGVVAALLAIVGFCVSIAANVSRQRSQTALLSALGVDRGAQARQLCLKEFMLSLPSAVVGLVLGAIVSGLFVPATTLTTDATRPFPPVLTDIPWPLAGLLALVIAVLPVIGAAASAARHPDPAGSLRTAESA
jgi:hypothetical protein